MKIDDLKNRRVLILGLGKEGISSLKFLRELMPEQTIGVADLKKLDSFSDEVKELIQKDANLKLHLGEQYLDALVDYDMIIKSPGINPRLYGIEKALERGAILTSNTKLFFENRLGKIIGVTGTKGKSTTSTLIYEMLRRAGFNTNLIGNIGHSALDFLKTDGADRYYVFELSSYQLEDFNYFPDIGIFLSFFPDHLDYHRSEENYFEAKTHLFSNMPATSLFVYNGRNPKINEFAKTVKARKIDFLNTDHGLLIKQIHDDHVRKINLGRDFILNKDKVKLIGAHNLENIICAIRVAEELKIDQEIIHEVIENFTTLKHRLEYVGEYNGIYFYNDSLSTTPESTIAGIRSFSGKINTLILGGKDRGYDFLEMAKVILEERVENLILLPESGKNIWSTVFQYHESLENDHFLPRHFFADSMQECVEKAYHVTKTEKVCLLSCASPSFGMFKDYQDRADQYIKQIKLLA